MKSQQVQVGHNFSPLVRLGPKSQVTIPKAIVEKLQLKVGDVFEPQARNGNVVLIPKHLVEKKPVPKLSEKEQQLLASAKKKIAAINKNIRRARGLTNEETKVAAKVGLIDPDQRWWWTEEWQQGEREAEEDIAKGRLSGPFHTAEELIAHLRKLKT
jgi:bifunctional DNA-binding transcriptional regulator/antitoxin component of YhaV-PrlF toxin-antitoxin module